MRNCSGLQFRRCRLPQHVGIGTFLDDTELTRIGITRTGQRDQFPGTRGSLNQDLVWREPLLIA
jgi:hypothetical protein